jgi:hypothetical protein
MVWMYRPFRPITINGDQGFRYHGSRVRIS